MLDGVVVSAVVSCGTFGGVYVRCVSLMVCRDIYTKIS